MRTAAGLIVLLLFSVWGLRRRAMLKRRCGLIGELRLMLEHYSIEIACTAPTLEQLAAGTCGEFGERLRTCAAEEPDIRRAWSSAVQQLSELPHCRKDEVELLSELGRSLGTCPAESEVALLRLYSEKLDRLYDQSEKDSDRRGRLYSSGGVLAGLAAAVLLL